MHSVVPLVTKSGCKSCVGDLNAECRRNPTQKALEPLISVLDDQDMQVRRLAVEAITAIGGERALSALTQALPAEKDNMVKDRMTSGIRFLSAARPEKSGTGQ